MSNPFDNLDLGNLYASGAGGGAPAPAAPPAPGAPDEQQQQQGAPAPMMAMGAPPSPMGAPPPAPADPWSSMAAPAAPAPAAPVPPSPGSGSFAAPPPVPASPGAPMYAPAPAAPPASPGAMVPSAAPPGADPFGVAPVVPAAPPAPVAADPFGAAPAPAPGAMIPSAVPNADPFGVGAAPMAAPPAPMAPPAAPAVAAPGAMVPSAAPSDDPFGIFAGSAAPRAPTSIVVNANAVAPSTPARAASPPPGAVAAHTPNYASPPSSPGHQPNPSHVPGFDYPDSPPPAPVNTAAANGGDDDDFWATMGLAPAAPPAVRAPIGANPAHGTTDAAPDQAQQNGTTQNGDGAEGEGGENGSAKEVQLDSEGLPVGGEKYTARIQAPTLGVIFFTAPELLPSVFCEIRHSQPIRALETRPVVGHCFADSAALAAGILPGHVLLSVNGKKVSDPSEAKNAIRDSSRPLQLEFYVLPERAYPATNAEGAHMVKYDTPEEGAPASQWEWKPKYVVIGGIIAKPWMIMMYRSRAEYDIAVKTVMADRSPKVKIKQFSLLGASIYCDHQGPLEFNARNPKQRYFSIIPRRGYPIKISSRNEDEIKPVHSGVRRVIARHNGGGFDDRLSVGERNLARLGSGGGGSGGEGPYGQQVPYPRDRIQPRNEPRMSFYEKPTAMSLQTVGSY